VNRRSISANRRRAGGFTLLEVLVSILVVAVVAMVLLYKRIDVVRDAARVRDERVAWTLIALKMGDLSRDPALIKDSDHGDFSEDAPDQASFGWSYESEPVPVTFDDANAPAEAPPRTVRRVRLKIFDPEDVELQTIEAMFADIPREETP
jgi:prepilin-type N-terminal cleavage/methylation domain-containing protein